MNIRLKQFAIVGLSVAVTSLVCRAQSPILLTTFTNPTPAAGDYFGHAGATVGTNRVLIGAYQDDTGANNAGAAYLFDTSGALLTTFTNPTPAIADNFGIAVTAVGANRVLIGAWGDDTGASDAGAAYLFSTNGALLTTFTNPFPAYRDYFGCAVAALGSDWVLIGAYRDDTGAIDAGAAYLFSTNGTLLTTFTNPTPASDDCFGLTVAAAGPDRVLIGAYRDDTGAFDAGAAYLFSTNGTLLTTFTNPTPASQDYFGRSMAAVGLNRVLIGADSDDAPDAFDSGAAYLFSTNGTLLVTFTKPTPAVQDYFGYSVAAVGTDRVLIGAYFDNMGADLTGAAYLFSTNGELIAAITNPTPEYNDEFGISVAAVGHDRVLIGAWGDDTGAGDAGVAYLFSLESSTSEAPSLSIFLTATNTVAVSWPSPPTGWNLQQNTNGLSSLNWSEVTDTIQDDGTNRTLIVNPPVGGCLYRLQKP